MPARTPSVPLRIRIGRRALLRRPALVLCTVPAGVAGLVATIGSRTTGIRQ